MEQDLREEEEVQAGGWEEAPDPAGAEEWAAVWVEHSTVNVSAPNAGQGHLTREGTPVLSRNAPNAAPPW